MKLVYVGAALVMLWLALGGGKSPPSAGPSWQQYDRSDPKHPMHGVYSDSNCSVTSQLQGIHKCPDKEKD